MTDRHGMIKKYMRTEHADKSHYFDVWHLVIIPEQSVAFFSAKFSLVDVRSGLVKMNYSRPTGLVSTKVNVKPF